MEGWFYDPALHFYMVPCYKKGFCIDLYCTLDVREIGVSDS